MDLDFQEPFIERVICEIRYAATLDYFEKRIALCKQIIQQKSELGIWDLGAPQIQLRDENTEADSNRIFSVTLNKSSLIFRNPGPYENFQALSNYLMAQVMRELKVDTLLRVGIRVFYFVPVAESLTELKDFLMSRFFSKELPKKLSQPGTVKEYTFMLEFEKGKYDFGVRVGVLSPEEVEGTVYKGEKFYVPKEERSASILIDVDLSKKGCSSREVTGILKEAKVATLDVAKGILSLTEEENESNS